MSAAPGAHRLSRDRWMSPGEVAAALPEGALVIADARVVRLHPNLIPRAATALRVTAGEPAKTVRTLSKVLAAGATLSTKSTVVAIGGGTIGDLATVSAHLLRRGLRLIHVPTTLLAMVDSSVGGKGALNIEREGRPVRNAVGVYHYPDETWLSAEVLSTLPRRRLMEGRVEALKMFACLDSRLWKRHTETEQAVVDLIRDARTLKASVCRRDPYEQTGLRRVLNFGHTFGHVLESLSAWRLAHGAAVGLGILCALDLGRRLGVTSEGVADELEARLRASASVRREELARWLAGADIAVVETLLRADKKAQSSEALTMVLVPRVGKAITQQVGPREWKACLPSWRTGRRP